MQIRTVLPRVHVVKRGFVTVKEQNVNYLGEMALLQVSLFALSQKSALRKDNLGQFLQQPPGV